MTHEALPRTHVVIIGTGFAGLEAAFYLRKRLGDIVKITVVSDRDHFLFKPNTIYIPFGKDPQKYRIPIMHAFEKKDIDFHLGQVTGIDPATKTVTWGGGNALSYDQLILATGSKMHPEWTPGLEEYANTIWTTEQMMALRESIQSIVADAEQGRDREVLFLVPPMNKCSGPLYEMVFMLETWLRRHHVRARVGLTYATFESGYIQAFGPRLNETVEAEFAHRGITGQKQRRVSRVEDGQVVFEQGDPLPFDLLISFPAYGAALRHDALPSDEQGFLLTDARTRQVQGQPDIYAIGDTGDFPVKQAFLALLQADAAAEHLSRRLIGGDVDEVGFDPVSMCIMEQFDKATFAQVPLRTTGDPGLPVVVRDEDVDMYKVGSGEIWRVGKKMLGTVLPMRFRNGEPFHAGATWSAMEAGLRVMSAAFAD